MNDDACRAAQGLPWDYLIELFAQMLGRVTVDPDGTGWLLESDWAATEVLAYEVMRRTEEPDTVQAAQLRRLGAATMTLVAGIRYGTEHLAELVAEWVVARGELMVTDMGAVVIPETLTPAALESWKPALVPNDPLADYVDVEGGYRWFYDGRPPEALHD